MRFLHFWALATVALALWEARPQRKKTLTVEEKDGVTIARVDGKIVRIRGPYDEVLGILNPSRKQEKPPPARRPGRQLPPILQRGLSPLPQDVPLRRKYLALPGSQHHPRTLGQYHHLPGPLQKLPGLHEIHRGSQRRLIPGDRRD